VACGDGSGRRRPPPAAADRIYPDTTTDQVADVHPGALVGQARGILWHCADPGPLVTM